ncbi:MAG: type II toxin-antitoxin system death-on-curing family toxin [Oscillospiraceae bacterium]|jgi:death-on-curing protein|nr:type II toxin-antitoxin system death-on-curing family toxin [Oscillospiraceae bacterium]
MIILTVPEVTEIHEKLIVATGGFHGISDARLLESAVLGCYQSFGDTELYPGIIGKAGRMAYAVCKNHPFFDGNKRAAITSMLIMLRLNDIVPSYTQQELIDLGLGIADGSIDYSKIVDWLNIHI